MQVKKTPLDGLIEITPDIFGDERGQFYELFNQKKIEDLAVKQKFMQDNISISKKNVLRGLHLQLHPYAQAKLVKVIKGSVMDVAVDIRRSSSTYLKHYKVMLSDKNNKMLFIPQGFAHGFISLEKDTIFHYKCSNIYSKKDEVCLSWKDDKININWEIESPIISHKDRDGLNIDEFEKINTF